MAKITAQILDSEGKPLKQIAEISEFVPGEDGATVAMNVWSNINTGEFVFNPIRPDSYILVSTVGYQEEIFPANDVPAVIQLQDAIVINGKTTKKKENNIWLYLAGGLVVTGLIVYAVTRKEENESTKPPAPKPERRKLVI